MIVSDGRLSYSTLTIYLNTKVNAFYFKLFNTNSAPMYDIPLHLQPCKVFAVKQKVL